MNGNVTYFAIGIMARRGNPLLSLAFTNGTAQHIRNIVENTFSTAPGTARKDSCGKQMERAISVHDRGRVTTWSIEVIFSGVKRYPTPRRIPMRDATTWSPILLQKGRPERIASSMEEERRTRKPNRIRINAKHRKVNGEKNPSPLFFGSIS